MTRSVPRRVKTDSWTASSSSVPWCRRPPISEYSPSLFSRTITMSTSSGATSRRGDGMPGHSRIGRRFTYWRNARRIGISRPHSEMWSGTSGRPTAPRKIASLAPQGVERVGRHHAAGLDVVVAAPRVLGELELEPVRATGRLEHLERGGRDLEADPVARDHGNGVASHEPRRIPSRRGETSEAGGERLHHRPIDLPGAGLGQQRVEGAPGGLAAHRGDVHAVELPGEQPRGEGDGQPGG